MDFLGVWDYCWTRGFVLIDCPKWCRCVRSDSLKFRLTDPSPNPHNPTLIKSPGDYWLRRPWGSLKTQHLRGLPALEVWLQAAPGMHTWWDKPAGGLRGRASFCEASAALVWGRSPGGDHIHTFCQVSVLWPWKSGDLFHIELCCLHGLFWNWKYETGFSYFNCLITIRRNHIILAD